MTECAIDVVVQRLVKLAVVQDSGLWKGIHEKVVRIVEEMQMIQSLVKDIIVDKNDMREDSKMLVRTMRDVAYHTEDVIDKYLLHFAKQPHGQVRCFHFLQNFFHITINLIQQHMIHGEIQHTLNELETIIAHAKMLEPSNTEQGRLSSDGRSVTWLDSRLGSLFHNEDDVVGIESPRDELIKYLVEGPSKLTVISVVGMAGLGKTTLVERVYNNEKVEVHFDFRAWITVSQSYEIEVVLRDMIKQFCMARKKSAPIGIDTMNENQLLEQLSLTLQEQRYIVIFDDLWDTTFWEHIKYAFLENDKGSRIIITTRKEDVAHPNIESSYNHVYKLPPLTLDKASELFYNKAFQFEVGQNLSEFDELSRLIIERCDRLPLAIVVIGGLLSNKVLPEWRQFYESFNLELECNPHLKIITEIVSLSYNDLPYNLKACFLYFGMFPRRYTINCARLIRLWIAEGFVKERHGMTLEKVAQDYLNDLICRSLVQVENVDFVGKTRSCRVHDLLHDVILSRSEELGFCLSSMRDYSSYKFARYLSIQDNVNIPMRRITGSQTRSLLIFGLDKVPNSFLPTSFANFKLMKTVDFEGAPINYIPKEVGNLFFLKYLSLRDTKVDMLPKSIGQLQNLETLDLKRSFVFELPVEISDLHKLQYLAAYIESYDVKHYINFRRAVKLPSGIRCLQSLQKLHKVEASVALIEELGSLEQLRKLHISSLKRENGIQLCSVLTRLSNLQSLRISAISAEEVLHLESLSSPSLFLLTLNLGGQLETLPTWILRLNSLVRIGLTWSRLMDDPLKVLQVLPNLMTLGLYDAYRGEQLHFEGGGFRKLKVLGLRNLRELNSLIIDKDAMPRLETLRIGPSPSLNEVPFDIHHLRSLRSLQFFEMPREFVLRLRPEEGPDYCKVKHISCVSFLVVVGPYSKSYYRENYKRYDLGDSELWEHLEVNYRYDI